MQSSSQNSERVSSTRLGNLLRNLLNSGFHSDSLEKKVLSAALAVGKLQLGTRILVC